MGPNSTICLSKQLSLSNYKLSKISHDKTKELYIETQKFLDEKMKQCPAVDDYLLGRKCKEPTEFFLDLYSAATLKDKGIVKECGTLKSEF
jgi:hypothetical protein